jgi:rhodanese-related sulfurtransferase
MQRIPTLLLVLALLAATAGCEARASDGQAVRCASLVADDPRSFAVGRSAERLARLLGDPDHVVLDVRPASKFAACHLKGSVNHPFPPSGEGRASAGEPVLTAEVVRGLVASGRKVVVICSTRHRSLNAVAHALCRWGLPAESVVWAAEGVESLKAKGDSKLVGPGC